MSGNTEWRAEQSTGDEPLNWWVYEYQNGVFQRTVAHGLDKDTAHLIAAAREMQRTLENDLYVLEVVGTLLNAPLTCDSPWELCGHMACDQCGCWPDRLSETRAALAKSRGET